MTESRTWTRVSGLATAWRYTELQIPECQHRGFKTSMSSHRDREEGVRDRADVQESGEVQHKAGCSVCQFEEVCETVTWSPAEDTSAWIDAAEREPAGSHGGCNSVTFFMMMRQINIVHRQYVQDF